MRRKCEVHGFPEFGRGAVFIGLLVWHTLLHMTSDVKNGQSAWTRREPVMAFVIPCYNEEAALHVTADVPRAVSSFSLMTGLPIKRGM